MPNTTNYLALKKPVASDDIVTSMTSDLAGNMDSIDTWAKNNDENYKRNPGFAVSTGAANTYAVSTTPAPTALAEGMRILVKINVANTGASTLNWNGLGAVAIKRKNGSDVSAGALALDKVYEFVYVGGVTPFFTLLGESSGGNASPSEVISGKTFTNDSGEQTGTMAVKSGDNASIGNSVVGTTLKLVAPQGYYDGDDTVTIADADFVAANIKNGINIFGIAGNLKELKVASGSVNTSVYTSPSCAQIKVTGLGFKPIAVAVVSSTNTPYSMGTGVDTKDSSSPLYNATWLSPSTLKDRATGQDITAHGYIRITNSSTLGKIALLSDGFVASSESSEWWTGTSVSYIAIG